MHSYYSHGYGKYALHYHLLWCPKEGLFLKQIYFVQVLKKIIMDICRSNGYDMLTLEVQPQFIHVSVSVQPTVAPADVVRTLKSLCTIRLIHQHPELKKHYSVYGSLWKKGYLVSTAKISDPELAWRQIEN